VVKTKDELTKYTGKINRYNKLLETILPGEEKTPAQKRARQMVNDWHYAYLLHWFYYRPYHRNYIAAQTHKKRLESGYNPTLQCVKVLAEFIPGIWQPVLESAEKGEINIGYA
jgi:hypothetical protein